MGNADAIVKLSEVFSTRYTEQPDKCVMIQGLFYIDID
jgi:hypothetical protein